MFTRRPASAKLFRGMYKKEQYLKAIAKAKEKLGSMDVLEKARICGFKVVEQADKGEGAAIEVPFFNDKHTLLSPSLEMIRPNGKPASRILQAVVLHHLIEADGTPPGGKFIAFREMPGLAPYQSTIKWRIFDVLARALGGEPRRLHAALPGLGGSRLKFGDASAQFRALPRVPVQVVIWGEDETEPATANMLFDESVNRLLPLEDVVVLGELAAHRIKAETTLDSSS